MIAVVSTHLEGSRTRGNLWVNYSKLGTAGSGHIVFPLSSPFSLKKKDNETTIQPNLCYPSFIRLPVKHLRT